MQPWVRHLAIASFMALLACQAGRAAPVVIGLPQRLLQTSPTIGSYLNPVDNSGIFKAIQAGDRPGLLEIRSTIATNSDIPMIKLYLLELADAGLARIDGDFAASNAALDRALRALGQHADTTREINGLSLLAEVVRSGNLFLSGEFLAWIDHEAWLDRVYFQPIRAFYGIPGLKFPNQTMLVPLVHAPALANPSITVSGDERLPLRVPTGNIDGHRPVEVEVQASMLGVNSWVILDTGCLTGLIPAAYVARYHLPIIARTERGSDGFKNDLRENYVIVPEIRLGKTILHDQIFSVSPIARPVLGLLQMKALRHLTIDSHELRFGPQAPFDCHDPIRADSTIAGMTFRLLFPYHLGQDSKVAVLDTGDNAPSVLTIRTEALPKVLQTRAWLDKLTTSAGRGAYYAAITSATIEFMHFTAQDRIKYIQTPINDTMVSTGVLRLARFNMDMTDRVACLTPYHPGKRSLTETGQ